MAENALSQCVTISVSRTTLLIGKGQLVRLLVYAASTLSKFVLCDSNGSLALMFIFFFSFFPFKD
jgi:hypothetical protein